MAVITYLEAIRQALFDEMGRDERVFVIARTSAATVAPSRSPKGCREFGEKRDRDGHLRGRRSGRRSGSYMGKRPVCEIRYRFIAAV